MDQRRKRARVTKDGIFCMRCCNRRDPTLFKFHANGKPYSSCTICSERYKDWGKLTLEQKLARVTPFESDDSHSVNFVSLSLNRKLGPIPVSTTARGSCPSACSFKNSGCFAEQHYTKMHWKKVPERGTDWETFCSKVEKLPPGTLWRHNEAGDLPGKDNSIDQPALRRLVKANKLKRGFTFTHKPMSVKANRDAVAEAVREGFTINLSADSIEQADKLKALKIAPVVVVVPSDYPDVVTMTPAGHKILICLNESKGLTCSACKLCAVPTRESIVGFKAHGVGHKIVSEIVRQKRG